MVAATVRTLPQTLPRALPLRDPEAQARLRAAAARLAPTVLARDRQLTVEGPLADVLPAGGVRRGSTVALDGPLGMGSTTLACALAAAATSAGEWAAVVDPDHTFGARAAAEAGVVLERCAVVRNVTPERWATVVAALIDGFAVVIAPTPANVRLGDARRLVARVRERAAVLVAWGAWPAPAAIRLRADGGRWHGLDAGSGLLTSRALAVHADANELTHAHRVHLVS